MKLKDMKKVEIITNGEHLPHIKRLMEKVDIKAYTIFHNLEGRGHHGYHEGQLLFNEDDALVLFMTVVTEEKAQSLVEGLEPFFEKNSGLMLVNDTKMAV